MVVTGQTATTRGRSSVVTALVALLVLYVSGVGVARAEPNAASAAQYQALIREAITEFDAGNFAESHAVFERAYALNPNARSARGVGLTAFEIKRYVVAVLHLQAALADTRNPLTAEQRRDVGALLARALRFVGRIKLDVTPRDATVFLDHARMANRTDHANRALLLDLGSYDISVRAEGYRDANFKLVIDGGEDTTRSIVLQPIDVSPERALGAVTSSEPSSAQVAIQGASQLRDTGESVTQQWWFWTGIGAVVIAGAAVALGVALNQEASREPFYQGNAGSLGGP